MTDVSDTNKNSNKPGPRPGILKIMQSVLAGALGVQSNRRREEDFSSHSPWPYIVAGILFTAIFVVGLIVVVQIVLANQ
ncbi:DUF2970 domain-containing protein [Marinobacter salinexigens]|uniref:DUF2970 domain-containing protein n=1 Tax=Marinobacter salinexigens TaxID=2919747 RepID=A0A5B0VM02_9GAMM|nr:DUF2970 domain-containing protein [Marinobacter salinexigens]KAA1175155.1 DUF2970 domain-containing protein [Marinobacter salinexigens]